MDAGLVARTAERLRVTVDQGEVGHGKSGSGVYNAVREDGTDCVLKITSRTDGDILAGRRELSFYRELSTRVPIRTPTLLEHVEDDETIALLLTAHGAIDPPTAWEVPSWEALALDLARLHRAQIPAMDQWRPTSSPLRPLDESEVELIEAFWREDFQGELDAILDGRTVLRREIAQGGEAFVHGDCHTDNVLRDGGSLVWVDWQSARVGDCAGELAFVQARATPSGVTVPAQMLTTYCRERDTPLEPMRRAVIAAELDILIFEWPAHAGFDTPEGTRRVRKRARQVAGLWAGFTHRRHRAARQPRQL